VLGLGRNSKSSGGVDTGTCVPSGISGTVLGQFIVFVWKNCVTVLVVCSLEVVFGNTTACVTW
jgi:hypothetical protein